MYWGPARPQPYGCTGSSGSNHYTMPAQEIYEHINPSSVIVSSAWRKSKPHYSL